MVSLAGCNPVATGYGCLIQPYPIFLYRSNNVFEDKEFDYEVDYEDEEIYQRFIKKNRKKLRRTEPEYLEDKEYKEYLDE